MKTKKMIPSAFAVVVFQFLVYYITKFINEPLRKYDFTTDFDRAVPFMPIFIYIYILSYVFWVGSLIYVAKKTEKSNYYNLIAGLFISYTVCALFFIFLPTTVVRPEFEAVTLAQKLTRFIYEADTPVNLFPSMHCLISWFCFAATRGQKSVPVPVKLFNFIFAVLVCISTQATKQHYIVDLVAGVAFAEITWQVVCRLSLGRFFEKIFEHTKL